MQKLEPFEKKFSDIKSATRFNGRFSVEIHDDKTWLIWDWRPISKSKSFVDYALIPKMESCDILRCLTKATVAGRWNRMQVTDYNCYAKDFTIARARAFGRLLYYEDRRPPSHSRPPSPKQRRRLLPRMGPSPSA